MARVEAGVAVVEARIERVAVAQVELVALLAERRAEVVLGARQGVAGVQRQAARAELARRGPASRRLVQARVSALVNR